MSETLHSVTEEILAAHTQALEALAEAVKEPAVREGFKRLFRCLETWELELLTSQIGQGVTNETFLKIGGAMAGFRLMKDLLTDLTVDDPNSADKQEERGKRFTDSLLHPTSRPV